MEFPLSLKLLLDEDSQARNLVNLLRAANYDVVTVNDSSLEGCSDSAVLDYARQQGRLLLTRNCDDFLELHQAKPFHDGILAVYQSSDKSKNMSYQMIIKAIANLETSGYILKNQFVILNQWNW
jgi:predicted nuclease of predicted toxin-antitoxin system